MHPEQRLLLGAIARSLPWTAVGIAVTVAACVLAGAPRWAASMVVPVVAFLVPLAYARRELRAVRAAARERGATPPPRRLRALAAAHVAFPLVGVPLAIEGLRTGNRALAWVGTGLLVFVVVDATVLLPWHAARRQRRVRAGRP